MIRKGNFEYLRQFVIGTLFFSAVGVGTLLTTSFDKEYIAKVEETKRIEKQIADAEKETTLDNEEEKEGVAFSKVSK